MIGIEDVERSLGAHVAAGRNLTSLMADIGEYLVRTTKDRFRD